MNYKAGFIGCGNMGGALARAASKAIKGNIAVCDNDVNKTSLLSAECGAVVADSTQIINSSEFVFLGLKPQIMFDAVSPWVDSINNSSAVIVTMAAGLSISFFEDTLQIKRPIIRIMPNTPCSIGSVMILYSCNAIVTEDIESSFLDIMKYVGRLDKIPENLIDAASTISGCGPAFAFIFAEALADAGVECGIPRDKAILYASQMLKGSAELILQNSSPATLKDNVCSPGGTTIAGVHALESSGFRAAAMNAVVSAYKRTLELKK